MKNKTSRHGKNAVDQIKLSCKVDFETWRRVNKAADEDGKETSAFLRGLITEAVWNIPLTKKDYEIIESRKQSRKEKGI